MGINNDDFAEIVRYCEDHGIDFKSLHKILNEPKVVPMIRGIGFEYIVETDLKRRFSNSKRFEITKPQINAQLGIPDIDVGILDKDRNITYKFECKLAKNKSFKKSGMLLKQPHCLIKIMRSRTLGAKSIKTVSKIESISEILLSEHRDSYLYHHFDFVITNLRNAFYKTISDKFIYSPDEEEIHFLSEYLNTNNYEEIDNILKKNHFFIESKKLTPKFSIDQCRKKVCSNKDNCEFVPNYPIFALTRDTAWKPISELENYLLNYNI